MARKGSSLVEKAVFAAALLLAAFIARELWLRRAPAPRPAAEVPLSVSERPEPAPAETLQGSPTERGVAGVPPMKLSRSPVRKPKPAVVPAPR